MRVNTTTEENPRTGFSAYKKVVFFIHPLPLSTTITITRPQRRKNTEVPRMCAAAGSEAV